MIGVAAIRKIVRWNFIGSGEARLMGAFLINTTSEPSNTTHLPHLLPVRKKASKYGIYKKTENIWKYGARLATQVASHHFPFKELELLKMEYINFFKLCLCSWSSNLTITWNIPILYRRKWDLYCNKLYAIFPKGTLAHLQHMCWLNTDLVTNHHGNKMKQPINLPEIEARFSAIPGTLVVNQYEGSFKFEDNSAEFFMKYLGVTTKVRIQKLFSLLIFNHVISTFQSLDSGRLIPNFMGLSSRDIAWSNRKENNNSSSTWHGYVKTSEQYIATYSHYDQIISVQHMDSPVVSNGWTLNFSDLHQGLIIPNKVQNKLTLAWDPTATNRKKKSRIKIIQQSYASTFQEKNKKKREAQTCLVKDKWTVRNLEIAIALFSRTWGYMWKVQPKMTMNRQFFWYLLKLNAHNVWRTNYDVQPGCPLPLCKSPVNENFVHIIWECGRAQTIWKYFIQWWYQSRLVNWEDILFNIFSWTPPVYTQGLFKKRTIKKEWDSNYQAFHISWTNVWRILIQVIISDLWQQRNEIAFTDSTLTTMQGIAKMKHSFFQILLAMIQHYKKNKYYRHRRILHKITSFLQDLDVTNIPPIPSSFCKAEFQPRIYFDGGSRHNPGPGGGGAVLLRWEKNEWVIIDYAAIYLPDKKTTNNIAEYVACLAGLRLAMAHEIKCLQVIGDSQMILEQVSHRKRVKDRKLQPYYKQIQKLITRIPQCTFHHTYREGNKTADLLANLAMDYKQSCTFRYLPFKYRICTYIQNLIWPQLQAPMALDTTQLWATVIDRTKSRNS